IMAIAVAHLRPLPGDLVPEAIVPEPAFEIFRFDTTVAGGRLVQVMPKADFAFPLDEVLAAVTPRTRVVYLTNPNNPTGVATPFGAIRTIARRVPKETLVFVDEAYAEFAGRRSYRRARTGRRRARHLHPRSVHGAGLRRLYPRLDRHRRAHAPLHRGDGRGAMRRGVVDRRTSETSIALVIALDGKGRYRV